MELSALVRFQRQRKGRGWYFQGIISSVSTSFTPSGCLRGSGTSADSCRHHYTSHATVPSLKGLADGYPNAASTGTSNCSHLHSILMRPSWYFCTALKRLSKNIFPSDMRRSPSADYAVCSCSHANTPWRPGAYPHAHSLGNSIFPSSQHPRTVHKVQLGQSKTSKKHTLLVYSHCSSTRT